MCVLFNWLILLFLGRSTRSPILQAIALVFAGMTAVSIGNLCYKNVSLVVMKRLLIEANVIIIVLLGLYNLAIEIVRPDDFLSPFNAFGYMLIIYGFVFLDVLISKSRYLLLGFGTLFIALNLYLLYGTVFGDSFIGTVLFEYTFEGNRNTIMKRSMKRSIYLQLLLFSANSVYTMFIDKGAILMMFATGNVKKTDIFSPVQHSSLAQRRFTLAQYGILISTFIALSCYVFGDFKKSYILQFFAISFVGAALVCFSILYVGNVSFAMIKRLLIEPNVIIITLLVLFNLVIDINKPHSSFSPVNGVAYALVSYSYVFSDALVSKSRYFVLTISLIFVILNIYNIYGYTLGGWDDNVTLLQYSIQSKGYTITKQSTKRSIFFQILLFSANGMYVMLKDKTMTLMIFATSHVYRSTGTSSAEIENASFPMEVKREVNDGENMIQWVTNPIARS